MTRRRRTDVGWINARENWYRDLWLLIITTATVYLGILAVSQSGDANRLAHAIQQQRIETLRRECQQENARHDGTILELDRLFPNSRSFRKAEQATTLLIDHLAPKQNCATVVASATRRPRKPSS